MDERHGCTAHGGAVLGRRREPAHTNGCVLRVVGMSRSGNHAIIGWILDQCPGSWLFLNCVEPETNPFFTARPLDDDRCFRTNIDGFDLQRERQGLRSAKDLLLYSHEDTFLKKAFGSDRSCSDPSFIGTAGSEVDILILRDPFNLFASRWRMGAGQIEDQVAMRIWKQHARAFVGGSRDLRSARRPITISYNRWCCSMAYRRQIAERLGLEFTDAGFEAVTPVGGGSSFDGTRLQGRASSMATGQRWRSFADRADFRRLFDGEVLDLSARIFGPLPMQDILRPLSTD